MYKRLNYPRAEILGRAKIRAFWKKEQLEEDRFIEPPTHLARLAREQFWFPEMSIYGSPITLSVLVVLTISSIARANSFLGKAVAVHDGDTISVLREGKAVKIRLAGIDAPEKKQAFGIKAKAFTSNAIFGKSVMVEIKDTDGYGRFVAKIVLQNGKCLNHELLRAGLAWWYRQYAPQDKFLESLKNEARRNRRGLWRDTNPVPPSRRRMPG